MKNFILTVLCFFLITELVAQNQETRNLSAFTDISVGESIKVYLTKGSENSARIETSGVDTDKVLTEQSGPILNIHMARGRFWRSDVEVYITYTEEIEELKVSSSASLVGNDVLKPEEMEVRVSSSGKIELDIETNELDVEVSSSGRAFLDVEAQEVDVRVSSSGKLELSGSAEYQKFHVSSSGKLLAYNLETKRVRADISSSGSAEISVTEELIADASSSGRISYRGNPNKVLADTSSSGKVRKAE